MSYYLPFESSRQERSTTSSLLERLLVQLEKMPAEQREPIVSTIDWVEPQMELVHFSAWDRKTKEQIMKKLETGERFYGEPHHVNMSFPAQILGKFHNEDFLRSICKPNMFAMANYLEGSMFRDPGASEAQGFEGMFAQALESKSVAALKVCLLMVHQNKNMVTQCHRWFARSDRHYLNLLCSWGDNLSEKDLTHNMNQIEPIVRTLFAWSRLNGYGVMNEKLAKSSALLWQEFVNVLDQKDEQKLKDGCERVYRKIASLEVKKGKKHLVQELEVEWELLLSEAFERCVDRGHAHMVKWFLQKPRLAVCHPYLQGNFVQSKELTQYGHLWMQRVNETIDQSSKELLELWMEKRFESDGYRVERIDPERVNRTVSSVSSSVLNRLIDTLSTSNTRRDMENEYKKRLRETFKEALPTLIEQLEVWSKSSFQLPWINVYSSQGAWGAMVDEIKKNAKNNMKKSADTSLEHPWLEKIHQSNIRPYVLSLLTIDYLVPKEETKKVLEESPVVEGELSTCCFYKNFEVLCRKLEKKSDGLSAKWQHQWEEELCEVLNKISNSKSSYEKIDYGSILELLEQLHKASDKYPEAIRKLEQPMSKALATTSKKYGIKNVEESIAFWEALVLKLGMHQGKNTDVKPKPLRV